MEKEKKTPGQSREDERDYNLRFYNEGREVPEDALKEIKAGRLKGMSDVNPMWRMKRMTEMFGPCGLGWKYTIDRQWTEQYGNEVKCFCNVSLYIRDPETGEWSDAIPGNGGSSIVSVERNGAYVNDEGYKMALTDALSIAMKPLGIGANIWYGPKARGHNESKYEAYTQAPAPSQPSLTAEQVKLAMDELNASKSMEDVQKTFLKWQKISPSFTKNGTPFFNRAGELSKKFKTA